MADQLQLRGGTTTEHATFTGALREVTVDTDKDTVVVHDNATAGGHPLLREDLSNLPAGTIDNADINANAAIDLSKLATGALPTAITVASANIVDETIVNADVSASAAIAGTKISPDFGSQNVVTTGTSTAASLIPTGSSVPANGVYLPAANEVAIATNTTERARIDSSGRLLVGTSTNIVSYDNIASVVTSHELTAAAGFGSFRWAANAGGPVNTYNKSRGASVGTRGAVISGDALGTLALSGDDGTNFIRGATISAAVDGTPGTNNMPGRLVFSTTAAGSSTPTERMRIDNTGKLLSPNGAAFFGTVTDSGNGAIMERGSNANGEFVKFADGTMICFRHFTSTAANPLSWTYPAAFTTTPAIALTVNGGSGAAVFACCESPSATGTNVLRFDHTGAARNFFVFCNAVGRWY